MEQIIFLIAIAVISALHSWWKKRQGEPEDTDDESPWPKPAQRRPAPPRPEPASNWEEELRRVLEGPPAPTPPPVPPVVPTPPPRPAVARPYLAKSSIPVPDEGREEEIGLPVKMPTMAESAQAFLHGRTIGHRTAAHFHGVEQQVTRHIPHEHAGEARHRHTRSPDAARGLELLRERSTQRAAIIASIVLGPPKSLERQN